MRLLAIVPARQGSKRLPNKNMRELGDKTLVQLAIESAGEMDCVVTSDSLSILEVAARSGAMGLFRPPELATDEACMSDVVRHVLSVYPLHNFFVLLQPTSPLRTSDDVRAAIEMFKANAATSLISTAKGSRSPNGAIYVGTRERFMDTGLFCDNLTIHYEMPTEKSVDVDTLEDFERAEDYVLGPRVVYGDGHVGRRFDHEAHLYIEKPPHWDTI